MILTASYGRDSTVKIFQKNAKLDVLCVGTDHSYLWSDFNYIEKPNKPLSVKWNSGIKKLREYDPDYVICMGSDDVLSDEGYKKIHQLMESGVDFVGFIDIYIYSIVHDRMKLWDGYKGERRGEPIGAGRTYSKKFLDRLDWDLWSDDRDSGLDWLSWGKVKKHNFRKSLISCRDFPLYDIKDGKGMTKFKEFNSFKTVDHSPIKKYL